MHFKNTLLMPKLKTIGKMSPTEIFSLLSSESRFKILTVLFKYKDDDICVQEIADEVRMTHSATSHQLAILEKSGIIESFRNGKTVCYFVNKSNITKKVHNLIKEAS